MAATKSRTTLPPESDSPFFSSVSSLHSGCLNPRQEECQSDEIPLSDRRFYRSRLRPLPKQRPLRSLLGPVAGPKEPVFRRTADPPLEGARRRTSDGRSRSRDEGSGTPVDLGRSALYADCRPGGITGRRSALATRKVQPRVLHRFVVMAINRQDGKVVWERPVREGDST